MGLLPEYLNRRKRVTVHEDEMGYYIVYLEYRVKGWFRYKWVSVCNESYIGVLGSKSKELLISSILDSRTRAKNSKLLNERLHKEWE